MIHVDEHGNKYLQMADGARAPLIDQGINVRLEVVLDGRIIDAPVALAVHQTAAAYWYRKYQESQTEIADLREQLTARD